MSSPRPMPSLTGSSFQTGSCGRISARSWKKNSPNYTPSATRNALNGDAMKESFGSRIGRQIIKTVNGCWFWIGARDRKGYGRISVPPQKKKLVHRATWEMINGPIPKGMLLCHKCDTPSCVNPDHLFLGSHQDNADDMVAKGRSIKQPKKTHCKNGHEFIPENTFRKENGTKGCAQCRRERSLIYRHSNLIEVREKQRVSARRKRATL